MKKNIMAAVATLFISVLPVSLFTNCDRDTNCYLEVRVVDSDKKTPLSNTPIKIHQSTGDLINLSVNTDALGMYSTSFHHPAIVTVDASRPYYIESVPEPVGERRGQTSLRLVEGETVTATVIIKDSVYLYDNYQ